MRQGGGAAGGDRSAAFSDGNGRLRGYARRCVIISEVYNHFQVYNYFECACNGFSARIIIVERVCCTLIVESVHVLCRAYYRACNDCCEHTSIVKSFKLLL